jgi:hypothetical protein
MSRIALSFLGVAAALAAASPVRARQARKRLTTFFIEDHIGHVVQPTLPLW